MNENQYRRICEGCDQILLSEHSSIERVAIPWLHVVREHPFFLRHYEKLINQRPPLARLLTYLRFYLCSITSFFGLLGRALWSDKEFPSDKNIKWTQTDFVFVSHLLQIPHLISDVDFYFGTVPKELAAKNKTVLIVLINHTSVTGDALNNLIQISPIPRVVIPKTLSFKHEFLIWRQTVKEAGRLRSMTKREIDPLQRDILRTATIEATSCTTVSTLRISRVVGKIISECCADTLITTYEGHAWERVVYATARKVKPKIRCIGYQHAALLRLQHAARRSLGECYDPTQILTAGRVGLRQLEAASMLPGVSFDILGSDRAIGLNVLPANAASCLVLPEGIVAECKILFKFSLACAKAMPKMKFILRLHPILSVKQITQEVPILRQLPPNVEISTNSLVDDISRSAFVLYRGSTAVIPAAASGVTPIYLIQPGELTIDPLYEISEQHPSVENVTQFIDALKKNKWTLASRNYCNEFYLPINSGVLMLE